MSWRVKLPKEIETEAQPAESPNILKGDPVLSVSVDMPGAIVTTYRRKLSPVAPTVEAMAVADALHSIGEGYAFVMPPMTKRPPGRPPAGERKRRQVPIRLSIAEQALLQHAAELEGRPHLGTWLREVGLLRAKRVIARGPAK